MMFCEFSNFLQHQSVACIGYFWEITIKYNIKNKNKIKNVLNTILFYSYMINYSFES